METGCWLQCAVSSSGLVTSFDDNNCEVSTGTRYLCSTNDKGGSGIFPDHTPGFVATAENCKVIEGESAARSCMPAREIGQSDLVCEPLNPTTMKIKAQPRINQDNFHELVCCDSVNVTSGFTNQCAADEEASEVVVMWCATFGIDGTEPGAECLWPKWLNILLVVLASVCGFFCCVKAYLRCAHTHVKNCLLWFKKKGGSCIDCACGVLPGAGNGVADCCGAVVEWLKWLFCDFSLPEQPAPAARVVPPEPEPEPEARVAPASLMAKEQGQRDVEEGAAGASA